jgi:hypothetical protein
MHFPSFITFHKLFWLYSEILYKINNIEVYPGKKTEIETNTILLIHYFVHHLPPFIIIINYLYLLYSLLAVTFRRRKILDS